MRPHLVPCVQFWASHKENTEALELVYRQATKPKKDLESKSCEKQLRELRLFRLEKSRLRDILLLSTTLKGGYSQVGIGGF